MQLLYQFVSSVLRSCLWRHVYDTRIQFTWASGILQKKYIPMYFQLCWRYNGNCVQVTCDGHDDGKEKIPPLRQGEIVWAKHRNTRYYKAKVDSIHDTLFYMVTFSDNSFSDDLYPSDIMVSFSSTFYIRSTFYNFIFFLESITDFVTLCRTTILETHRNKVLQLLWSGQMVICTTVSLKVQIIGSCIL